MDEREPAPTQSLTFLSPDFIADCRGRGLSLRTVDWYDATLARQFLPWSASEEIVKPSDLTPQVVGRFTARRIERKGPHGPLRRSTVRSYVRAVRVFLAWAQTPEGGAAAVGASPRLPRPEQGVLDVLTRGEIQAIENAAKTERDKLLVRVLADCGLRLGEVIALRPEDLWEPRRSEFALKVRGKGRRDRIVPLAPALYGRLRRYLTARAADPGATPSSSPCERDPTAGTRPSPRAGSSRRCEAWPERQASRSRSTPTSSATVSPPSGSAAAGTSSACSGSWAIPT